MFRTFSIFLKLQIINLSKIKIKYTSKRMWEVFNNFVLLLLYKYKWFIQSMLCRYCIGFTETKNIIDIVQIVILDVLVYTYLENYSNTKLE